MLLGHAAPGFAALGFSPGLVLYLTLAGIVLVGLGLRSASLQASAPAVAVRSAGTRPWPGAGLPRPADVVLRSLGLAGLVAALACAWFGSALYGANPVSVGGTYVVFWIGGQVASALLGDGWRLIDPFDTIAALVDRVAGRTVPVVGDDDPDAHGEDDHGDWWVPAVLLLTFGAMWLAWPDGIQPRSIAKWLSAYTVVMVVGAAAGGRAWVRRNEAFAVAFGLLAEVSPIDCSGPRPRLRNPLSSLAGRSLSPREGVVLATLFGIAVFDAVVSSQWWNDVLGVRSIASYTVFNLGGLLWLTGTAAIAGVGAARVAAWLAGDHERLGLGLIAPAAAIAACFPASHELGTLCDGTRGFLVQLSDPLDQGWNLLGTAGWRTSTTVLSPGVLAWATLVVLESGLLFGLVALQRRAVARFGPTSGAQATWAVMGAVVIAAVVGLKVLMGV